ncbi:MAG: VRR-NUC domain-containing protein [Acetobacterium sp.]|uniref:VRR-NUC domain-containing protein n=1 Tax=Acetobacterium sp. TaxID=1872094 RepID=UPI003242A624
MREKEVEQYLVKKVKEIGGKAFKFTSPGNNGVPDRLVCLPGGRIVFVELKAPGCKTRPDQNNQMKKLHDLGCDVFVIDNKETINGLVEFWREWP